MKKLLSIFIMTLLVVGLAACNKPKPIGNGNDNCVPSNDADDPNFCGEEIVILHGALNEVDANRDDYSGNYKQEKIALQEAVEEKYNVKIVYKQYPDHAPWGPERVRAIIDSTINKEPLGHIYAISTNWIPDLANANAIVDISDYDYDYGSPHFTDSMKSYATYQGGLWGFEVGKRYNDVGLFYNEDLIVKTLGLEDPATLWNDGQWTWDKFRSILLQLVTEFEEDDYYAISGDPGLLAMNMVGSNGGTLLDPDFYDVTITGTRTIETLNFLNSLYNTSGVWDPNYGGDTSPAFTAGKVGFHLGELWFVSASNRFGQKSFDTLSYVPMPVGPQIDEDLSNYKLTSSSAAVWAISAGYEKENAGDDKLTDEMIYRIWTEMQYWIPEDELDQELYMTLGTKFTNSESVEAYMSVKEKNYYEQILNFVNGYDSGLYSGLRLAVLEGDALSKMQELETKIQNEVDEKLQR